jgi:hypothetical protein
VIIFEANISFDNKARVGKPLTSRMGQNESSLHCFRQTVQDEMAKQQGKRREGKKEMSDLENEARVGKPWTSRIKREQFGEFGEFSSNCPGQNGG